METPVNIPGIKAAPVTIEKVVPEEMRRLRQEMAEERLAAEKIRESRAETILEDVKRSLANLETVVVTDEMRELKIDRQVFALVQRAQIMLPILRHLKDDDAVEATPGNPFGGGW